MLQVRKLAVPAAPELDVIMTACRSEWGETVTPSHTKVFKSLQSETVQLHCNSHPHSVYFFFLE